MIRLNRRHAFFAAFAPLLFLSGCQQSVSQNIPASNPGPTGPIGAPTTVYHGPVLPKAAFPPTPAILPKPASLGTLTPPIIAVPPRIAEPVIRVRISAVSRVVPHILAAKYRGHVEIDRLANGSFVAVNVVPIESYLAGVLSKELYPSWSPTTYRAQAIAARTYALYQIATTGAGRPWNVTGTVASQMYGGKSGESRKAWNAVLATRGEVMETWQGGRKGIFCAYYSACNGGASQSPQDAWGDYAVRTLPARLTGPLDAACPKYTWPPMRINKWILTGAIKRWGIRNNLPYLAKLGLIKYVAITKYNRVTGRPVVITLTDASGHSGSMRAEEFRLALLTDPARDVPKPPSSFFRIQNAGIDIILTHGRGYGHGIGLSQWGAQDLARQRYSARGILAYYYPGETIHHEW